MSKFLNISLVTIIFSSLLLGASCEEDGLTKLQNYIASNRTYCEEIYGNEAQQQYLKTVTLSDVERNVSFYFFIKKSPKTPLFVGLKNMSQLINSEYWNPHRPTKLYMPGVNATPISPTLVERLKDSLLQRDEELNVIGLDYGPISSNYGYYISSRLSPLVGKIGGLFIDSLVKHYGAKLSDIHVIGHSLGAQVAALVARSTRTGKVSRLTGLEPVSLFFSNDPFQGIQKSDAHFVDTVHTASLDYVYPGLTLLKALGHADFYINGGMPVQPSCGVMTDPTAFVCSHLRASDLFTESALKGHLFPALSCRNLTPTGPTDCFNKPGALMGYPAQSRYKGLFYVKTRAEYPFSPVFESRQLRFNKTTYS